MTTSAHPTTGAHAGPDSQAGPETHRHVPARVRRQRRHRSIIPARDRAIARISAELASGTLTLRQAVNRLYGFHVRTVTLDAIAEAAGMPGPLAEAHVVAAATRAHLDIARDAVASEVPLAVAERRLGEVLVLPDGSRVGPPPREHLSPRDLW